MEIESLRRKQLYQLLSSLLNDYNNLLTADDLKMIKEIEESGLKDNYRLEELVSRIWKSELDSGKYRVISWNKAVTNPDRSKIVFATLSYRDDIIPFCDAIDGVEYEITYDALFGACPKDGATVPATYVSDYTVAIIDGQIYNSYNGATRLITPKQLINLDISGYKRSYNELILDASKIKKISDFHRK